MLRSIGTPSLELSRYFLSQISSDASWYGMVLMSLVTSFTTEFMMMAAPLSARSITPTQSLRLIQDLVVRKAETNQAGGSPSRLCNTSFRRILSCYINVIRHICL